MIQFHSLRVDRRTNIFSTSYGLLCTGTWCFMVLGEKDKHILGVMDCSTLGLGWSVASMLWLWQAVLRWHKTQAEGEGIRRIQDICFNICSAICFNNCIKKFLYGGMFYDDRTKVRQ